MCSMHLLPSYTMSKRNRRVPSPRPEPEKSDESHDESHDSGLDDGEPAEEMAHDPEPLPDAAPLEHRQARLKAVRRKRIKTSTEDQYRAANIRFLFDCLDNCPELLTEVARRNLTEARSERRSENRK
jgi:hypothetical protein